MFEWSNVSKTKKIINSIRNPNLGYENDFGITYMIRSKLYHHICD